MLETTILFLILLAVFLIAGVVLGWIFRSNQATGEKATINAGWQEQLAAQRSEHKRLIDQNRSLMQQINEFQVSLRDAETRVKQTEAALNDALANREALKVRLDDTVHDLDAISSQRDSLRSDIDMRIAQDKAAGATLKERDEKIFRLSRELESWQERLPPLMEKYRERNDTAQRLEAELDAARQRIAELEVSAPEPVLASQQEDDDARATVEVATEGSVDAAPQPPLFASNDNDLSSASLIDEIEASMRHPIIADGANPVTESTAETANENAEVEDQPLLSAGIRDDLQRIRGIGPTIEKTLNEMGIFRFNQIAELSEYDIDRVANRLRGFHSRIHREDWIGQARALNDRKSGTRY